MFDLLRRLSILWAYQTICQRNSKNMLVPNRTRCRENCKRSLKYWASSPSTNSISTSKISILAAVREYLTSKYHPTPAFHPLYQENRCGAHGQNEWRRCNPRPTWPERDPGKHSVTISVRVKTEHQLEEPDGTAERGCQRPLKETGTASPRPLLPSLHETWRGHEML